MVNNDTDNHSSSRFSFLFSLKVKIVFGLDLPGFVLYLLVSIS